MDYGRYDRFFIILEEQSEGFAMRQSANVKGHIKIETGNNKGAMRIGVQNLKYQDRNEYIYKLIFFGNAREKTIYAIIGTVNVNKMGNGETYFRFDPNNIDKNGHTLFEFTHAIVAAVSVKDEKEPLHPVLKGTFEMPFSEYGKEEKVEAAEIAAEQKHDSYVKQYECETDNKEDSSEESCMNEEKAVCYNSYYNKYLCAQCFRINRSKNVYDRILPFRDDATSAEWTKMCDYSAFPMVSPGAKALSQKYKHYIFGCNEKYYYLGVPGRFLRSEQPEEGISGFLLWQPIIGAENLNATDEKASDDIRKMAYGYWIVAVDKETGDIVEA